MLAIIVAEAVVLSTSPTAEAFPAPAPQAPQQQANLTAMEIDAIVSPIALYPDQLIAQILGAATYPDQVDAADNWVNSNKNLQEQALMQAADMQPWDPSVKALTQFPTVLDQMATNLAWTSSLGDASYNQQADVMASIQRLRTQAKNAGNLKTTQQITVVQQSPQTIVIQPANPQVVYVPQYNPTVVYGTPYSPPGYSTAAMVTTGLISFGLGIAVGAAISNRGCCGWGWGGGWGCNWRGGNVMYQNNVYVSRSTTFYGPGRYGYRNTYYGGAAPNSNHYNANNRYNGGNNRNTNISGNTVNINTGNKNTNVNNSRNNSNISNNRNSGNTAANNSNISNNRNSGNTATNNSFSRQNRSGANLNTPQNDRGFGQQGSRGEGALSGANRGASVGAQSERGRQSMGAQSRQAPAQRGGGRQR